MKSSHIIIIAVIFVLVAGSYFFMQKQPSTDLSSLYSKVTPALIKNQVEEIRVKLLGADGELFIKRDGNRFEVKVERDGKVFFAPAKEEKIAKLISDLSELYGEMRGEGEEILGEFGLGKDEGLLVAIKEKAGKEINILVGKKGPRWNTSFVRLKDSHKVFLVSKDILMDLDIWNTRPKKTPEARAWIDLQVIKENRWKIKRCDYQSEERSWTLFKKEKKDSDKEKKEAKAYEWIFKENKAEKKISSKKAEEYLGKLFPLVAKDVINPEREKEAGFSQKGQKIFSYQDADSTLHKINIGKCDKEGKCIIKDDRGYLFEIDKSWVKALSSPFEQEKKDSKSTAKNISKKKK